MASLKDMKAELRELRKSHPDYMPVSRLKKADVSSQIERLKVAREETPAPAAVPSASIKKSKSAVEDIKTAKKSEFPVKPAPASSRQLTTAGSKKPAKEAKKKDSKLAKLMRMMDELSSSEEEL